MVNICGQINQPIKECGKMTFFMDKVFSIGVMVDNMMENGKMIKKMVMGNWRIMMEEFIKANSKMIRKMVKGFILGLMGKNMMGILKKASIMERPK